MGYYLKTIHVQWFIYFSFYKWTEEIIGINEAGDLPRTANYQMA